jgi:gamma-glutamyltranspeptidase / glutathione hydrolase
MISTQELPGECIAENGMVASAHPLASQAGLDILHQGGNAIDAALAIGLTLNVVEPNASGIGGGGFMLVKMSDRNPVMLDFREKAPAAVNLDTFYHEGDFQKEWTFKGGRSISVPGLLKGYQEALNRFGSVDWKTLTASAIQLATDGFCVSDILHKHAVAKHDLLLGCDATRRIYLHGDEPYNPGETLRNPDLANTLSLLAAHGPEVFYQGKIADAIVSSIRSDGGVITKQDLQDYEVKLREPVHGNFNNYEIVSVSPPSCGGTHLIQLLKAASHFDLRGMGHNSPDYIHHLAEAMKWIYADRERYMADPDFAKVPHMQLLSEAHISKIANAVKSNSAAKKVPFSWSDNPFCNDSTTHISVVDRWGNAVALTQTIGRFWGSGVAVAGYGFLLNDQISDFDFDPRSPNLPQGGKRPRSTMAPTIMLRDGRPYLVIGSPGGVRIVSACAQVILNATLFDMPIDQAIDAPRFHCFSSGGVASSLFVESRISNAVRAELEQRGHCVEVKGARDKYFGGVQAILLSPDDNLLHGGADNRRDGVCMGH